MFEMMRAYFRGQKRSRLLQDRLAAGLTEDERTFLEAAEIGNLDVIKELLESGKVKVDCCDQQGRTALEMATAGNDVEVVCYLLERSSGRHIHKALLAAADNDMERICELILDHPLYRESVRRESERLAAEQAGQQGVSFMEEQTENQFSHANLSKLLLEVLLRAAKRNNFQIVKKIMMCGVFLDEPHDYFCACEVCTEGRAEDFKVYTTRRLDTYAALASPSYISLTAEDPILTAFQLSKKFRTLSEIEGEYKQIYQQLDQQVQNFTLALLDQCQSSDEVKAVLSGKIKPSEDKDDPSAPPEPVDNLGSEQGDTLPLVYTAVRLEQKKFVAHPQCQAQIGEMWYSGVPFLRYLNRFAYLMLAIPIGMVACPLLSIVYLVTPWSKVSRIVNTPLMKFLSYTCSYLTFLILIIVSKLYFRNYIDTLSCDKPDSFAYVIITIVFMWIMGLIFEECKQIFSTGAKDYFASFWNVIDSIMLSLLLASFVLELVTPYRLHEVIGPNSRVQPRANTVPPFNYSAYTVLNLIIPQSKSAAFQDAPVSQICLMARENAEISNLCQVPPSHNFQVVWDPAWVPDPELLSDVLFGVGIIFSVSRFSFIMPANEALGTMLVSFRRTIIDIVKIFGMFILVLLAFTCGIAALYTPSRCLTDGFDSFSSTLSTLTWSMFGMGSLTAPALSEDKDGPVFSLTNNLEQSRGAATVGYYLYGVYVFCTMVVLLNLLIAVMSNTFQEVQDERDIEWKFARTELWLTFIEPGTPVPPPFNIMPSPRHIWKAIMWMCRRSKLRHFLPHEGKKVRYVAVQDVMCMLIRRYVRAAERMKIEGEDGDKASTEDFMRRQIERLGAKVEKRMDELQSKVSRLQRDMEVVKVDGEQSHEMQKEHYDRFVDFSGKKTSETDRYAFMLDEAKLQILSRMDSERIQMERVLEHRVGTLARKLDESTTLLSQQVDRLQALKGMSSTPSSPGRSK